MQIHWRIGEELSEAAQQTAEERLERLADGHSDLIDVTVSTRSTGHHRLGGREVRITGHAPHAKLVAGRTRAEMDEALTSALQVFEREVHRMRERRRARRRRRLPDLITQA